MTPEEFQVQRKRAVRQIMKWERERRRWHLVAAGSLLTLAVMITYALIPDLVTPVAILVGTLCVVYEIKLHSAASRAATSLVATTVEGHARGVWRSPMM